MALKITDELDTDIELSQVTWNPKINRFELTDSAGSFKKEIEYVLKPDLGKFPLDDYVIYIFQNNNILEKHIFQVSESDVNETIGFIFPIQALVSAEHDYTDHKHFLIYAFKAFYKLLKQDNEVPFLVPANKTSLNLTDFYPADAVILILWEKRCREKIKNFNIANYCPFLYQYGYYYANTTESLANKGTNGFGEKHREMLDSLKKTIKIKRISSHIENNDYIIQLFTNLLPYQAHPLVVFHLLYQVIELLMPMIARIRLRKFIKKISEDYDSLNSLSDVKDDLDELYKIQQEKGNITELFTYGSPESRDKELKQICNEFLKNEGLNLIENPGESLYKVRNFLVHNYRNLSDANKELFKELNMVFESVVIDLLINYAEFPKC